MTTAVVQTIFSRLATMDGGYPVVWENTPGPRTAPRFEVQTVNALHDVILLDGGGRHDGKIQITAVVAAETGLGTALNMIDAIRTRFPVHQAVGAGQIAKAPEVMSGFQDGAEHRIPIHLTYRVFT